MVEKAAAADLMAIHTVHAASAARSVKAEPAAAVSTMALAAEEAAEVTTAAVVAAPECSVLVLLVQAAAAVEALRTLRLARPTFKTNKGLRLQVMVKSSFLGRNPYNKKISRRD